MSKLLATILATFVDDERIHARSEPIAWNAAHQVATRESYLGIQDAARKRRPPSQNAGAWAGSIIRTNNKEVGILVSDERWQKTRSLTRKWLDKVLKGSELNTKDLLSDRGFLIYISRTYRSMIPYLKGLHLTIDGWRDNRDLDGWKEATSYHAHGSKLNIKTDHPLSVKPVPRLINDLKALERLTESRTAPIVLIQSKRIYVVRYGFGDASGGGFGSSISDNVRGLEIQIGTWNEDGSGQTSNFREFGNFVIRLEKDASEGKLRGSEIFLFTDNSTTEAAFFNGTSSSKTLFELVLRLRKLELMQGVRIHLIHVAGTRMIEQGTDGISRGNLLEGVMVGKGMLTFIPISISALDRSPLLLNWIRKWTGVPDLSPLSEADWLWKGQGLSQETWTNCDGQKFPKALPESTYLWAPPPSIADVALEMLRKSLHKQTQNYHIFVCPKLMTPRWRKLLLRTCDVSFYVDVGAEHWGLNMHESLLIGIYLPLLHCPPWSLRRSKSVLTVERKLRQVQQTETGTQSSVLCKFLSLTRRFPTMSKSMVRSVLLKGRIR